MRKKKSKTNQTKFSPEVFLTLLEKVRLIACSSCSGMKRRGLQSCLNGKSPRKDPEKKAKFCESPVIRDSPAEAKAVAQLWVSCCSRRHHGKGMENDLCLQRSQFSWVQESGLASHNLPSVSRHPLLSLRPPKPGMSWNAASPPALSCRGVSCLGWQRCRSTEVCPSATEPSAGGAFCHTGRGAAGTAAAHAQKLGLSL